MSSISALAGNGILRYGKTSKCHGCSLQREESLYHCDTMLRSGPSACFLGAPDTSIPPRSKGSSGFRLSLDREGVRDRSAKRGGFQRMPCFPLEGVRLSGNPARTVFPGPSEPCGNDMIDAHVENLMDSKAAHRFTTVAWKSLRLSHNHLDNCFAVPHISTTPATTDS